MPRSDSHEQKFFNALNDIFVGAKIEGESGYINLMAIKSRYYQTGVFPQLKKDIDAALVGFPDFREELFDKLYSFFQRYFSESGSIYFRHTPLHQNVYEKVYSDERDVVLFWKTHMLYYVKTDRLFKSLLVEVDEYKFWFDASQIELKRSNEKRDVVFSFREKRSDRTLVFDVNYSERGNKTKEEEILKALKKEGVDLSDETLNQAFRVFEKQSEVDFFINKDARSFLREQFDLWMYQYLFEGQNIWSADRLAQLQALKGIAYKVIDFISQFEDELVKIWNKPKFVRNSHYVITLDKLQGTPVLEKILAHSNFDQQVEEWRNLGMVDDKFQSSMLIHQDLAGDLLHPQYQYIPFDTKYFPDLELEVLGLFDDIDFELDGWLIKSENYQALTTIKTKYHSLIQCIHIDPPYNTETSGFLYLNQFQHSSWITMMDNRISLANGLLCKDGSSLTHIDENEIDHLLTLLRSMGYGYLGTTIWDKKNPMMGAKGIANQHEYIIFASVVFKTFQSTRENIKVILDQANKIIEKYGSVNKAAREEFRSWILNKDGLTGGERAYSYLNDDGRVYRLVAMGWPNPKRPPEKFFTPLIHPVTGKECPVPASGWSRTPEKMQDLISKSEIVFGEDETTQPQGKVYLNPDGKKALSSVISNASRGKNDLVDLGFDFSYAHPVSLYEEIIESTLESDDDLVLDYFAGSGTTAHAVMNLNREDRGKRKYILVEMGEHFNSVILPRIKKVAFNSKWSNGKPVFGKRESGISHFVKYYDLEQYEDVLQKAHYEDSKLFNNPNQDPYSSYVFLRDLKMLESLDVDYENNHVSFHPERLYPDIDLAETLSHLTGKWIRHITAEYVEFEDGEKMSLTDPDWQTLKPMIWWQ